MKWLTAGLTFVNATTVFGLLGGIANHGLNRTVATASALAGLAIAFLAYCGTYNAPAAEEASGAAPSTTAPGTQPAPPVKWRYRSIWLWIVVAIFAMFALRSFCNVLFIDGNELKIQNPNNLGDLSLHLTYINTFASGVALWPDNPIHVFSKLRYPAGIDLFNALLVCLRFDLIRGLVWVGLLSCAALCYALYRWGGTFTIAGFLFNGGLAGFQLFKNYEWKDYEGVNFIAWKSLALSMLVTQRGLLYALPVGLLLLYQWRAKFFPPRQVEALSEAPAGSEPGGLEIATPPSRPPLPFWVEVTLYATMPLFHVHTFMALSFVLLFLFFFLNARARIQLVLLALTAFLPATYFVWLISDHFHAGSVVQWNPGWVQNAGDFARPLAAFASQPANVPAPTAGFFGALSHFVKFWGINFGLTLPLIVTLLALVLVRTWKRRDEPAPIRIRLITLLAAFAVVVIVVAGASAYRSFGASLFVVVGLIPPIVLAVLTPLFAFLLQRDWKRTIPVSVPFAFVIPAVALFLFSCLVKTAPWDWDNIKLIIWAYLIVLPFVWSELVSRWAFPIRAIACVVLFGSGFVTIFGGLAAGAGGFGLTDRAEFDAMRMVVRTLPPDARFAAFPIYNHPLLLQGRKIILGYPGHVWTQGIDFGADTNRLTALMNGAPGWKESARYFRTRYLFWGRKEKENYPQSKRPWEQECKLVTSGFWGAIYDLESPRDPAVTPPGN